MFSSVSTSHNLIPCADLDASIFPSGEKSTEIIASLTSGFASKVAILVCVAASHTLMLSAAPKASSVLSGENATGVNHPSRMAASCPPSVAIFSLVATSHTLTIPSQAPEARIVPSGENATETTSSACPLKVAIFSFVATSHSFTSPPPSPEARIVPSGENATETTSSACPSSAVIIVCVSTSHNTTYSAELKARIVPSGENVASGISESLV